MNTKICPTCNAPIPVNAPGGLCPACVLRGAEEPPPVGRIAPSLEEVRAAFPQLEVGGLIGQGGMGFVYKARQPVLDRTIALKILSPELSRDPAFAERFAREARVLGKLNHPNIVTVFEHGESGGFYYLLMEFVDGVNLRQAMRAGRFTPPQALAVVPGICDALQAAHSQGVWHRDIKPENILLDARGNVKIADFGIARIVGDPGRDFTLTATGAALGSAAYMAPEQHEKPHDVDHRADIYSLGVVFYEMLTGELPLGRFPAPSQRAAVSARIDEIVFQTLEKERTLRQQSAEEVKTDVTRAASTAGGRTPVRSNDPPATIAQWSMGLALGGIVLFIAATVLRHGAAHEVLNTFAILALAFGFIGGCIALSKVLHGKITGESSGGSRALVWLPVVAITILSITVLIRLVAERDRAMQSAMRAEAVIAQSRLQVPLESRRNEVFASPTFVKKNIPKPDALLTVEQPILLPGDALIRLTLMSSVKGGSMKSLDTPVVFKTAPDRESGFILRWYACGEDYPGTPNSLQVELVDPDTGKVFHHMETNFEPPVRLSSPNYKPLPAENAGIGIPQAGHTLTVKMLRAETPADPGAVITEWREVFADVAFINPTDKDLPSFQLPQLPIPPAPATTLDPANEVPLTR